MKTKPNLSSPVRLLTTALFLMFILSACSEQRSYNLDSSHQSGNTALPSFKEEAQAVDESQMNTEEYDRIVENAFVSPLAEAYSTFSIDVDAASYANMRRYINDGSLPQPDVVRTEELVNYFNYDYPEPNGSDPFAMLTELSTCPWNTGHHLVHIGLQGKNIPTDNLPPSNLVFLFDVSGSMNQSNKLPLLKQSFRLLVDELRPEDHVSIVVYAGASGLVLPPTAGDQKLRILEAIDQLEAGGSTAGGQGIELAYEVAGQNFLKEGNNRVILATDGDFNIGMSSDAAMERLIENKRETGVFLTVLGFGTGNYKDSKMQKLADAGNGNHAYIDNILEAKKVLVNEFGGTLFTIAKDVKIQVEFNPEYVKGYRLIGYENRLLAAQDFNDDQKDAGELGSGHTVTALYEIIPTGSDVVVSGSDPLRYQKSGKSTAQARRNSELMHVKFRYKQPDGEESVLLQRTQSIKGDAFPSENFRWAAAVAEFALILRNSEHKGKASYEQVLELAQGSVGDDLEGYRQEFIGLVKRARLMDLNSPMTNNNEEATSE